MTILGLHMNTSVTEFGRRFLEIGRRVERTGEPVATTRRDKVNARLAPSQAQPAARRPREALRDPGGELLAGPGESVLRDEEFRVATLSVLPNMHSWVWCLTRGRPDRESFERQRENR